jgi:hypothetical protein
MSNAESLRNVLIQIIKRAIWAPLAVFIFHSVAGPTLGHEPYVDPASHILGGMAIAYFFWTSANCGRHYLGSLSLIGQALLVFGLTAFIAVAWELMELFFFTTNEFQVQKWWATMPRDLFLGIGGAALLVGVNIKVNQGRNSGK